MDIATQAPPPPTDESRAEDRRLVEALRRGDEAAFASIVQEHGATMLRVARGYVHSRAVAEEVVQETWLTWLGVLRGIDPFEGRSSLKTWIFRILVNRARTRGVGERRSTPFSSLPESADGDGAIDPSAFIDASAGATWAGWWAAYPRAWESVPEARLLGRETLGLAERAIEALPERQREVLVLRDVVGMDPDEVCSTLGLSDGNQRVLLHRARGKVRRALEAHLGEEAVA
jgi:RNA polymerase sigma-70 factor (ECF subfamily)